MAGLGDLARRFYEYVSRRAPGSLSLLNLHCTPTYGVDCVSLLFTSPSRLNYLLLKHLRGDERSADYAFKLLFLSPLASLLGAEGRFAIELLELAKAGRDRGFLELVAKYAKGPSSKSF